MAELLVYQKIKDDQPSYRIESMERLAQLEKEGKLKDYLEGK